MPTAAKKTYITPEEYLARERAADFKSEYYDGQIYAMSGTTRPHGLIAANISRVIGNQITDRACELFIGEMRVQVSPAGVYTYPDIVVVCGEPQLKDGEFDTLLNPNVIIEILSPSTEAWDRGGKFGYYRRLDSLSDYVLVSQDKVLVEHFTRHGEQWLLTEWSRLDDSLHLASIQCEVALRDIFAKVTFDSDDARIGV